MYTYLLTPGVGNLCTLLASNRLTHNPLVCGTVHGVRHTGGGGVLIVKITDRSVFTYHLGH